MSEDGQDKFPLWYFISQRVRSGVEKTFEIGPIIWLLLFVAFFFFACLHSFLKIAYVRISVVVSLISVAAFLYMIYVVRKMSSVYEDNLGIRIPPVTIVTGFQLPLFILCFVATRLVMSTWLWVYWFWLALFVLIIVVAFFFIFPLFVAPMVITYLIKTSFPPHTDAAVSLVEKTLDEYEMAEKREEMKHRARYDGWRSHTGGFRQAPGSPISRSPMGAGVMPNSQSTGAPGAPSMPCYAPGPPQHSEQYFQESERFPARNV